MGSRRRSVYVLISVIPVLAAALIIEGLEPFPHAWLNPANEHYWSNLLRAFAFLNCGLIIGLIVYTMVHSVNAEARVSGGHPRKLLYRHVTIIAGAHGLLILTLMFYIRERINADLSPATPLALASLWGTVYALVMMVAYQNSRLRTFHAAKQVLGRITQTTDSDKARLCVTVLGGAEPIGLEEWLESFDTGELVRLTVEKVEEEPSVEVKPVKGKRRA